MVSGLLADIEARRIKVGIVGLGYVGLPLALRFTEAGFQVMGFDIDDSKSRLISRGESYFSHISNERVNAAIRKGLIATADWSLLSSVDAVILCVPTPLGKHKEPDLSFVRATIDSLLPFIRSGQIISLESTSYPGTTEEEVVQPIERLGLSVGRDVFVVYSPEREDPGNVSFTTKNIPKVIGGHTKECLKVGMALYGDAIDVLVPVSSTKTAELTKLLENIYRSVNIGLVNELKIVADKMDIDIYEVIEAASSKPFGFTPFFPGPGLGGHCIPIDPYYLTWKAKEYGVRTRFIELAGEINSSMPEWVLSKIEGALNGKSKSVKGSRVLVVGVAYKRNTSDTRESPGIRIMSMLEAKGAKVLYHDPHVSRIPKLRGYNVTGKSVDLNGSRIATQDCLVICTDHSDIDFGVIAEKARLIVDTRNVISYGDNKNVVRA